MDMEIAFSGGKRVDALYKGFTIQTDQSVFSGGEGSAPQPFDLFLASIGTCAGIYVLVFCQQRKIPTEGIRLIQRTEKDREIKMITKISIEIQLPPDFPEKYKAAVIKAAGYCGVKRHMHQPPAFEIYTTTGEGRSQAGSAED
jgi:ribosomal protein S12 methylthiotransferase accessory factor